MLNGAGSTRLPLMVSVAMTAVRVDLNQSSVATEPALRCGAEVGSEAARGACKKNKASSALHDAVDASCRLGEAEAPEPHLVALGGLDLVVEPARAQDVRLPTLL